MIYTGWIFEDKAKVKVAGCLTHDFEDLIDLAGLRGLLSENQEQSAAGDHAFVENWKTAKLWKSSVRYEIKTKDDAIALRDAIINQPDGVMPWITKYW